MRANILNNKTITSVALILAAIFSQAGALCARGTQLEYSQISVSLPSLAAAQREQHLSLLAENDAFAEGIKSANRAVSLTRKANSPEEWNDVAVAWLEAATWMQAVPPRNPRRALAQKKVIEYLRNFAFAKQRAAATTSNLPFPTFGSDILDQQLQLYLSYLSAFGPPDILIVGSSRALQGIDPGTLQQALAAEGYRGLRVFNFSVNGATAQVVDFKLRELLSPKQLPRLIIWADGARAFNEGRVDRTYEAIVSSPGYSNLKSGKRPSLSWRDFPASNESDSLQASVFSVFQPNLAENLKLQKFDNDFFELSLARADSLTASLSSEFQSALNAILNQWNNVIDSNGFLPVSARFNPFTYYRQTPRVAGQYDGDYASFRLGGRQAAALNSLVAFTRARSIPLVFVNLPLTQDYLDSVRMSAEQQFVQDMQRRARSLGFIFRNLSRRELTRNDFFADPSHINRFGAAAVSRALARDRSIPWPK